jgi:hypothetical protein
VPSKIGGKAECKISGLEEEKKLDIFELWEGKAGDT